MSYFTRNKWWAIAFVLLVALNVATLLTFWLVKEKRQGPPPVQQSGIVAFLTKELSFDSLQKQKLVQLLEEQQKNMREIRRNNRGAKDAFFALLKQENIADSAIQNAAKESARYESQMDVLTFKHFQSLRNLCNETQKKKFDSIIQEVLRMIAPPPGGQQRPPPPRGEGPPPHDGPPPGEEGSEPPPPHPQQ
jgi:protein CpxP